jgi:hypothetical protein
MKPTTPIFEPTENRYEADPFAFIALAILAGAAPSPPAQIAQSSHGIASPGDAMAIAAPLRAGGNVILCGNSLCA